MFSPRLVIIAGDGDGVGVSGLKSKCFWPFKFDMKTNFLNFVTAADLFCFCLAGQVIKYICDILDIIL